MKRVYIILWMMLLVLPACSGSSDSSDSQSGPHELSLRQQMTGSISTVGEVNWYYFHANETNRVLQVRCTSKTLRPDVDLLVSVFELDGSGHKVLICGDHAKDGAVQPADITLNTYINQPKDIYVSVRDLMDDDSSNNPYYLSIDYEGSPEGNDSFAQATPLTIDGDNCPGESIGSIGDLDCFEFSGQAGIYDVGVNFIPFSGTKVQLLIDLYNEDGKLVERSTSPDLTSFHLVHFLEAGRYYVSVSDYGRDDFDRASTYNVCVKSVTGAEGNVNDTQSQASLVTFSQFDEDNTITGAIDYSEDQDWYRIGIPDAASGFKVLHLDFSSQSKQKFQVNLVDSNGSTILSHVYGGGSGVFETQVKLGNGEYFLVVSLEQGKTLSQSAPYTAVVKALNILDDAEVPPNDNDTIENADPLMPTSISSNATQGKIGYRGDVDWYNVTIPAHAQPQVLEFYFNAPVSQVEYTMSIMGSELEKKLSNQNAETQATSLKTSLYLEPNSASAIYSVKIGDFQDDDGDDAVYNIRADLKDVPAVLPAAPTGSPMAGLPVTYLNEADDTGDPKVTLEYNSSTQSNFSVNTDALKFSNAVVTANTPENGLTTITFPWVGGYIDFQGDQDWLQIDFQPLDSSTQWYYTISVDFYAPASEVEYVWKFYPDRNDNKVVADRSSGYDGFIASAGDDGINSGIVNLATPGPTDDPFWVGDLWQGPAYFSISDFNYLKDQDGHDNTNPDEDWGGYGLAPYYFRVTLVYHPGSSHP